MATEISFKKGFQQFYFRRFVEYHVKVKFLKTTATVAEGWRDFGLTAAYGSSDKLTVASVVLLHDRVFFFEELFRSIGDFGLEDLVTSSDSRVDFLVVPHEFQDLGRDFLLKPQLVLLHAAFELLN